ncbi:MAG: hypothetical protein J6D02_09005 [Lachnospira sp.]|nr:hypothetical protein [Lachnospira sp.]
MNCKRKAGIVILIIFVVLFGTAVCLYYQQETDDSKRKQTISNATTKLYAATEIQEVTTNEVANVIENENSTAELKQETSTTEQKQNKKLPNNYEWDEKRWGEPPQIVYDFAENQEKFDFIVSEVDSLLSEGEGFTTRRNNDKLYAESENGEQLKQSVDYLMDNTLFYKFTKKQSGHWIMEYKQEEDRHMYIYTMRYAPGVTEEEAWDNGYMKVVGDWYFATIWKV